MTTDSVFILFKKTDFNTILACLGGKVYWWWRGHKIFVAEIGRSQFYWLLFFCKFGIQPLLKKMIAPYSHFKIITTFELSFFYTKPQYPVPYMSSLIKYQFDTIFSNSVPLEQMQDSESPKYIIHQTEYLFKFKNKFHWSTGP